VCFSAIILLLLVCSGLAQTRRAEALCIRRRVLFYLPFSDRITPFPGASCLVLSHFCFDAVKHVIFDTIRSRFAQTFRKTVKYHRVRNGCSCSCPEKGVCRMSAKQELMSYVSTLTTEQIEKLVNHLPELFALLEEPLRPCPLEQTTQNP
jgi:hypothetical protein